MKRLLATMLGGLLLAGVAAGCETRTGASDQGKQEEAVSRDGPGAAGGSRYTAPAPTGAAAESGYRPSGGLGGVAPGRE